MARQQTPHGSINGNSQREIACHENLPIPFEFSHFNPTLSIRLNTLFMTQMWPLWCPKTTVSSPSAAVKTEEKSAGGGGSGSSRCNCCCLVTKLMRKLRRRRHSKPLRSASRQGSIQCRYDPLSYALNFDDGRGGSGGSLIDEDDYKFYAFSSRFVVNPQRSSSCPIIPVVAGGSQ